MFMRRDQFEKLAEAKNAIVRMCFHGMRVLHECECTEQDGSTPVYTLRFVGHIIDDEFEHGDRESTNDVPEHRELTVDIPMSPDLLLSFAESVMVTAAQASACEMVSNLEDMDKLPEMFRALFSEDESDDEDDDEDDDENGESI